MLNRRRSERHRAELPVSVKDVQGREETMTVDVSLHGISIFAKRARALRQYVELEIVLPRRPISVTAFVARLVSGLARTDGSRERGLALDFYHLEADARAEWQRFVGALRSALPGPSAPIVTDAPLSTGGQGPAPLEDGSASAAPEEEGGERGGLDAPGAGGPAPNDGDDREAWEEAPPTFIIQPRDLSRLWSFFRGEMSRGLVRIESPISKPVGAPVEILVVHPETQGEWTIEGRIRTSIEQARTSRHVLEIDLVGVDEALRSAFEGFISSGRAPSKAEEGLPVEGWQEETVDEDPPEPRPQAAVGHLFGRFFLEAATAQPAPRTLVPLPLEGAGRGKAAHAWDRPGQAQGVPGARLGAIAPFADERAARKGTGVPAPERKATPLPAGDESASLGHVDLSTEGSNPTLDRDIAIARARVVRSPNSVTACFRLGTLLMRRGQGDSWGEAIDALTRVMELEPNHPGAHHAVAEAFAKRGDITSAREHLQRARRLGYQVDPELEERLEDTK